MWPSVAEILHKIQKQLYYPLFSYLLRIQNKQKYRHLFEFLFIPVYQSFVSSKHQAPSFFEEELAFAIIEHKIELSCHATPHQR
jgi:hypothetical protein